MAKRQQHGEISPLFVCLPVRRSQWLPVGGSVVFVALGSQTELLKEAYEVLVHGWPPIWAMGLG